MFRWTTYSTLIVGLAVLTHVPLFAQQASDEPPAGPGLDLIQRSCVSCHDIYMITSKRKTSEQWAEVMDLMAARGAEVTPDEMQIIQEYLTQNFSSSGANAAQQHSASTHRIEEHP